MITRRSQIAQMKQVRKLMPKFERKLLKLRNQNVKEILQGLQDADYSASYLNTISEPYLQPYLIDLYKKIGFFSASNVAADFNGKSYKTEYWYAELSKRIETEAGLKINLLGGSLRDFFIAEMNTFLQNVTEGLDTIENATQVLKSRYNMLKEYQVRRIVTTEALSIDSVAQFVSVDTLGVNYTKTWAVTGINTRDSHMDLDGVEVGRDELFESILGSQMLYPRDSSYGAVAGDIINCACACIYQPVR